MPDTERMNFSSNVVSSLKQNLRKMNKSDFNHQLKLSRVVGSSFVDPTANEQVGPDDFVAHQLLGTGSFGEVFLVEEIKTKELYAMKILSKEKIRNQKLLKYAFAERSIMAEITYYNQPYVVKVKYAFQTKESLFMVMQFCSGGDLSQYLELEGFFPEDKARGYICEIVCSI